jgi:stage III sporulation protein AD
MDGIMKAAAGAMITAMLGIILQRHGKEYAIVLVLAVSAMGACLALTYIKPVITFLEQLSDLANLDEEILRILLKAVGVGLIGEISGAICSDCGNASLGKMLQLLSAAVILWLSLPILQQVIDLIGDVLEGI